MTHDEENPFGSVLISQRAIATIAWHAALESYGVVGLAPKNFADGIANILVKDALLGVDVHYNGHNIEIDLYIIIEYGTRVKSVANSVANSVKFHVEKALGLPVNAVNVHVQGLRVSDLD
jgi:uncharacterized alkaline shock family protein YloU